MKTFATMLAIVGATSALTTPQKTNQALAGTQLTPITPEVVVTAVKPTATPFYFNLLSSDGNYVNQEEGSITNPTLSGSKSAYPFRLNGTTLQSLNSQILEWSGNPGLLFFTSPGRYNALSCAITGKYPTFGFNCAHSEKNAVFGNYGGDLAYGNKTFLKTFGATPITLTVEPYGPSDCSS